MEFVIGKKTNAQAADTLIETLNQLEMDKEDILYLGYPILANADESFELDGLLTSVKYGVIIFDFYSGEDVEETIERQNEIFLSVKSQLMKNPSLCKRRELEIPLEIISFTPDETYVSDDEKDLILSNKSNLKEVLNCYGREMEISYLKSLNATFQKITNIKPAKKRINVKKKGSKGSFLKYIEKEIANLDRWQKNAAIETPDGPQRIRGLAGSGKTIVLALKAAYLHCSNPDWNIAVTFNTRSLYDQFKDLVRRFTFEHINDEPDWEKIKIIHAWGSIREPGIYYEIARNYGEEVKTFTYAKEKYGYQNAFKGVCDILLEAVKDAPPIRNLYDAVLIDEAQDLPQSFFKLVYRAVPSPYRIVWAYDDLQNLGSYTMLPPEQLFGKKSEELPLVQLQNREGQAKQDIILPICYRNTPWALATAHALGMGIYREEGMIQFYEEFGIWEKIGYEISSGELNYGSSVVMKRSPQASPSFFNDYVDPEDAVKCKSFISDVDQAEWVAEEIHKNITEDELELNDILVIFTEPITVQKRSVYLIEALRGRGINTHIVGVTSSRDIVFKEDSVAISGIYRAKGNEAAMVYVMDAHHCFSGFELARKRNILFTAITRSRAWVRICGVGKEMEELMREFEKVAESNFTLDFTVPTREKLEDIRKIHRDMSEQDLREAKGVKTELEKALKSFEEGLIQKENLPKGLLNGLLKHLIEEDK